MPNFWLYAEHIETIRSGEMADSWFAELADRCWKVGRDQYIADLKRRIAAEVALVQVATPKTRTHAMEIVHDRS
jgi:predicted RNase H-related nuclease YkuK (DUF458 family)